MSDKIQHDILCKVRHKAEFRPFPSCFGCVSTPDRCFVCCLSGSLTPSLGGVR